MDTFEEQVADNTENDALLDLTNPPDNSGDKFTIPPLSMRSLILLEKIESPFVGSRIPVLDMQTGQQVKLTFDRWLDDQNILPGNLSAETHDKLRDEYARLNLEGRPVFEKVIPSMEQVAAAFFVLLKQDQKNIVATIRDTVGFEQTVLDFASTLTPEKLTLIAGKINMAMARVNAAAGPEEQSSKKVDGPTL